jgi:hypothetical protein
MPLLQSDGYMYSKYKLEKAEKIQALSIKTKKKGRLRFTEC